MTHHIKVILLTVLLALLASQIKAQGVTDLRELLEEHYDDGSEMI